MAVHGNSNVVDKNETKEKPTPEPSLHGEQMEKENLAPDGGWGWAVAAGLTMVTIVTISQASTFGMIWSDFLNAGGNSGSALTVVNLTLMISFSCSGLICNELLKSYAIKSVGLAGALLYAFANTTICLVPNVAFMALLFLIQGFGMGIMITVASISFNSYFVKRKTRAMGVVQLVIGLATIVYPFLVGGLLSTYGFRGTAALLGAISLNGIVSMYAMDPVERHCKKAVDNPTKNKMNEGQEMSFEKGHPNLVIGGKNIDPIRRYSMDLVKGWEKNKSVQSLRAEAEYEKPLLIEALKASHRSQDRHGGSSLDIETGSRLRPGKGSSLDVLANRLSLTVATSMSSINGIAGVSPLPPVDVKDADGKKKTLLSRMGDFFEVSLLSDRVYLNISMGSSFTLLTDILFNSFLPMIMASLGYTTSEIAMTLTVAAIAELIGKIIFMLFVMFVKIKARYIFLGSVYSLICCRIAFLHCDSLQKTLIVIGLSGIARSWFNVTQMLVVAEHFKMEKFPAAWGLFTIINGCNSVILLPLIGFIKDVTESYVVMQYVLLGALSLCAIPWTIEIFICQVFARSKTTETTDRK